MVAGWPLVITEVKKIGYQLLLKIKSVIDKVKGNATGTIDVLAIFKKRFVIIDFS